MANEILYWSLGISSLLIDFPTMKLCFTIWIHASVAKCRHEHPGVFELVQRSSQPKQ